MASRALALRHRGLTRDVVLSLLVTALILAGVVGKLSEVPLTDDPQVHVNSNVLGLSLLVVGTLSLTFRQLAPVPVLLINGLAFLSYQALDYRPPPLPLGLLVALFTVALMHRPLVSAGATCIAVLVLIGDSLTRLAPLTDDQFYVYVISLVAALVVGYGIQLGHARTTLAEERAAQLALEQDVRTRIAVQEEQARIARELHDIVAHDVSVIVAQAAAARRCFDSRPEWARQALDSIEAVGRDALQGMRGLVGLLRTSAGHTDRSPQPGLDRLPWLLDQIDRAGLPVECTVSGQPRPLPATVELSAYRIVQEALTNTLKHAGPTKATLALRYDDAALTLEIRDAGVGVSTPSAPGYGILGIQQRVALLGGEMTAGAQIGRGFAVTARLPVAGSAA
jgi:signal transduction histidine kinase